MTKFDGLGSLVAIVIFQILTSTAYSDVPSYPSINGTDLQRPLINTPGEYPSSLNAPVTKSQVLSIEDPPTANNQVMPTENPPALNTQGIYGETTPVIREAFSNQVVHAPIVRENITNGVALTADTSDATTNVASPGTNAANLGTECVHRNLKDDAEVVNAINGMIDNYRTFIQFVLRRLDTVEIHEKNFDAFDTELMKTTFGIAMTAHEVKVTGLSSMSPEHIQILDTNYLRLGFKDMQAINISGNVTVQIEQKEKSFGHPCLLSLAHPLRCSPKNITGTFSLLVNNVHGLMDVYIDQLSCAPGAIGCKDLSMGDFVGLVSSKNFDQILDRIKTRLSELHVKNIFIDIGEVAQLSFHTQDAGSIVSAFEKHFVRKVQNSTNEKKNDSFDLAHILSGMAMKHANSFIDKFSSEFGHTCIDKPSPSSSNFTPFLL